MAGTSLYDYLNEVLEEFYEFVDSVENFEEVKQKEQE